MLKTKKILSVLLSIIMAFGTFSLAAFAENSVISDVSIDVDIDAGMLIGDIDEFLTINTEGLVPNDDNGSSPITVYFANHSNYINHDEPFENDVHYDVHIYLRPVEGYEFDTSMKYVTVDGVKTEEFYIADPDEDGINDYIAIYLYDYVINAAPVTGEYVEKAEVTVDLNIGGLKDKNYNKFIEILTESLEFEDNYNDPAIYVYDENYDYFYGRFEVGETYHVSLYLTPKNGYVLPGYVEGYVNGEEVETYVDYWMPDDETVVNYVGLEFDITVEGEREMSIFERIANFFSDLFEKILSLFRFGFHPMPLL